MLFSRGLPAFLVMKARVNNGTMKMHAGPYIYVNLTLDSTIMTLLRATKLLIIKLQVIATASNVFACHRIFSTSKI